VDVHRVDGRAGRLGQGVEAGDVGLGAAWTRVVSVDQAPPRSKGEVVTDEGEGGQALADFLTDRKFA